MTPDVCRPVEVTVDEEPGRTQKLVAQLSRRVLVEQRYLIEAQLLTARTVGDVWRVNAQLARLDARLAAS